MDSRAGCTGSHEGAREKGIPAGTEPPRFFWGVGGGCREPVGRQGNRMYKNAGMNANRVARVVAMPQWGGGIHREHLEYLMGVTSGNRKVFTTCLMAAYRRGLICFCQGYVCTVPSAVETATGADRFVTLTR
jgi:hypothetical protein